MIREFDPEVVEQMRTAYNRPPRAGNPKRLRLSFDELLDRFSLDCNTFTSIGIESGVSRERIRQVYNKYFRAILGEHRDGRTRVKICTRKRNSVKRQELAAQDPVRFLDVLTLARAAGKHAGPSIGVYSKKGVRVRTTSIEINGKMCAVRRCGKPTQTSPKTHPYWRIHARINAATEFIICVTAAGVFVVPAKDVASYSGWLYIPTVRPEDSRYPTYPRRVDFWKYHEAWSLIP